MNAPSSSFRRRILWHILLGMALYWVGNVLAVFPWLISKTFGLITMFLSTILWAYISFYCFKHAPRKEWNRDTLSMAISFLVAAAVQDYFLYAVYRGVPEELYEATTFAAYGFIFLLPFLIRHIFLRKYRPGKVLIVSREKLLLTALVAVVALVFTLWSVKFW